MFGDIKVHGRPQKVTFQPYVLGIHRKDVTFVQGTADENRYTSAGSPSATWAAPASTSRSRRCTSTGKYDTHYEQGSIHAYSSTSELGYRFMKAPLLPARDRVSFDYASGDGDQNDAKLGTFDPLYPLAYVFFGFHAAFERKNLDGSGRASRRGAPQEHLLPDQLLARTVPARRPRTACTTRSATSRAGPSRSRRAATTRSPERLAQHRPAVDFGVAWLPTHHLLFYGTYLRFWPGQF